ncbi:MAG: TRAP transporter large permease [Treponemataceae bacterium]
MIWALTISAVVLLVLKMPIAFVLGISSMIFFALGGKFGLEVVAQRFFSSIDLFVLLAIPFFMLAGELMNKTGITDGLVKFVKVLVGRLKGGLAQVTIVTAMFFSGLSGAGVADASAIGSILIPAMKKDGFKADYAAAVVATATVVGPIIPPSIIMVVFASIMGMSVGALFMAGFIPGIMIGLSLMIMAYIFAVKYNHPHRKEKVTIKEFFESLKEAIYALLMPVVMIVGLFSGYFTATEAAAICVLYALLVGFVLKRTLTFKDLMDAAIASAVTSSIVIIIIGFGNVFGWVMAVERIPQNLAKLIISWHLNKYTFLLVVNVFLLFMGCIMESGVNAILLGPILMPIAISLGIHPLHFALVMLTNLSIGLATPPLGVTLFVSCPIAGVSLEQISKAAWPFLLVEIVALLLMTYIPEFVLILPRIMGIL